MTDTEATTDVLAILGVPDLPALTLLDRCDACGSAAYVSVLLAGTTDPLRFCGHHFHLHEIALLDSALVIRDERARLTHTS